MRDHRKLRAFELADAMVLELYKVTRRFPREELFGLTAQMRRSAISVASNIAEGCARGTTKEYVRFLDMAYGSCAELEYQLSLAVRLGYLSQKLHEGILASCSETARVLIGLMRSLQPKT